MSSHIDTVALHGWTAVPADANAILEGKPYLNKPTAILTKDIPFPSSDPLVARVQAYAKEKLPQQTYNHCMRVYYWYANWSGFLPFLSIFCCLRSRNWRIKADICHRGTATLFYVVTMKPTYKF